MGILGGFELKSDFFLFLAGAQGGLGIEILLVNFRSHGKSFCAVGPIKRLLSHLLSSQAFFILLSSNNSYVLSNSLYHFSFFNLC